MKTAIQTGMAVRAFTFARKRFQTWVSNFQNRNREFDPINTTPTFIDYARNSEDDLSDINTINVRPIILLASRFR